MICKICQNEFDATHKKSIICSEECVQINRKRIKREYYLRNTELVKLRAKTMAENGYKWIPSEDKKIKYREKRKKWTAVDKNKNPEKYIEKYKAFNNNEKRKAYMKEYYKNNTEQLRKNTKKYRSKLIIQGNRDDYHLRRKFGFNRQHYDMMSMSQNHLCLICKQPETRIIRGKVARLAVDHCHKTGKIRGLLCARCNLGIGRFEDSPELLRESAKYIEDHASN
jgi:hypothetical protein